MLYKLYFLIFKQEPKENSKIKIAFATREVFCSVTADFVVSIIGLPSPKDSLG